MKHDHLHPRKLIVGRVLWVDWPFSGLPVLGRCFPVWVDVRFLGSPVDGSEVNSPVEVGIVFPIIYATSYTSKVVQDV